MAIWDTRSPRVETLIIAHIFSGRILHRRGTDVIAAYKEKRGAATMANIPGHDDWGSRHSIDAGFVNVPRLVVEVFDVGLEK